MNVVKLGLCCSVFLTTLFFAACDEDASSVVGPETKSETESSSSVESSFSVEKDSTKKSSSSVAASSSSEKAKHSSSSEASSSSKKDPAESSSSSAKSSSSKKVDVVYSDAVVRASGTYDCTKYSCVSTEFLNQDLLASKDYGEVLDERDGQVYRTIQVANQIWMAQNLNYKTDGSYCYKGEDENCAKYGRLYKWSDAVDSAECDYGKFCSLSTNVQGVCPTGWHLPSEDEWNKFFEIMGTYGSTANFMWAGKWLKSKTGWQNGGNGDDEYGFSAYPTGYKESVAGKSLKEGSNMYAWTATEYSTVAAKYVMMSYDSEQAVFYQSKEYLLSVRCLKNPRSGTSGEWAILPEFEDDYGSAVSSKDDYLNPDVYYDSIKDPRDGQVYKTVKIDSMVWMAQNLNYSDSVKTPSLLGQSWCYNDDDSYCKVGGRLYSWAAAIDSVKLATSTSNPLTCGLGEHCEISGKVQGICPDGWHLPDYKEFSYLEKKFGTQTSAGKVLKAQHGWGARNGTDDFGFSSLPVGGRFFSDGYPVNYNYAGEDAFFWTSTSYDDDRAYRMNVIGSGDITHLGTYPKYFAHSIRCVKD